MKVVYGLRANLDEIQTYINNQMRGGSTIKFCCLRMEVKSGRIPLGIRYIYIYIMKMFNSKKKSLGDFFCWKETHVKGMNI